LSEPDSDDEHSLKEMGFFEYYYFLQLADASKDILNDIFICIIEQQSSDKGKST